jgi:hypothetical protein
MYLHYFTSNNMSGGAYKPMSIHTPKLPDIDVWDTPENVGTAMFVICCCCCISMVATFIFKINLEKKIQDDPQNADLHNQKKMSMTAFQIQLSCVVCCIAIGTAAFNSD